MAQVSSYILTEITGKTPANPKAPEGDLWVDPNAPVKEAAPTQEKDSTIIVTDSTTVVLN